MQLIVQKLAGKEVLAEVHICPWIRHTSS